MLILVRKICLNPLSGIYPIGLEIKNGEGIKKYLYQYRFQYDTLYKYNALNIYEYEYKYT